MKKLNLLILIISLFILSSCSKETDNTSANLNHMFRANGWKPVKFYIDLTDNNIDDFIDSTKACHLDNYEILRENGTSDYYAGASHCSSNDVDETRNWWWDNSLNTPENSAFYYKKPSEPIEYARLCNIKKIDADSFIYTVVHPETTYTSQGMTVRVNRFKILVKAVPR